MDSSADPDAGFKGEKRSNATDQSTTDPEARLAHMTHTMKGVKLVQKPVKKT